MSKDVDNPEEFLFDDDRQLKWEEEWQDMPEFVQKKEKEYQAIIVRFDGEKDVEDFAKLIGQKITPLTQSIWFPQLDRHKNAGVFYGD